MTSRTDPVNRRLEIRKVGPGDEAGLSEVISRAFGLQRSSSFWAWWLRGPDKEPSLTRVCLDQQGKVVGMCGSNRRWMTVNGDDVPAVLSGDLYIDQHHRTHSSFRRLAMKILSDLSARGPAFLYGFPNAEASRAVTLVGLRTVGEIQYLFRFLDATPYIARRVRIPILARALAGGLNTAFRLTRLRGTRRRANLTVREVKAFDQRFDALWEREKARLGVTTVRRADYLNWRYIASPVNYRILAAETGGGSELLGFMVLTVSEARGRRMGALVDCLCSDRVPGVFDSLLVEAVKQFAGQGCHVVRAWALPGTRMYRQLRKQGFIRKASGYFLTVHPGKTGDPDRLLDPANWYLTQGDSDHIDGDA